MKTEAKLEADEINLIQLAREYQDEAKARSLMESFLWPNGPVCPHCKNAKEKPIYQLKPAATSKAPARAGVYKCGACRKQFTVTVGTVFEGSHIPISTWLMAIFIICSSKKAISAHQLHRMLGITYKTAWFMAHRIRFAFGNDKRVLTGTVEVDETFVGGKGDIKTKYQRQTPVMALVQRDGYMQARVIASVTQHNVGKHLHECVAKDAIVNTDEHGAYRVPLKKWKAHQTVVHSRHEYSRENKDGSVSGINHCESFFSLLKRGVYGAWHCVSREHLAKYASEFQFRWNHRKMKDGERFAAALPFMQGPRLMYRQPAN
jgi:transposase-like protein